MKISENDNICKMLGKKRERSFGSGRGRGKGLFSIAEGNRKYKASIIFEGGGVSLLKKVEEGGSEEERGRHSFQKGGPTTSFFVLTIEEKGKKN